MSGTQRVRQIAESLIRASSRRLPEDERTERCKEWSAELPAILGDSSVRPPILRSVRALRYAAGISRTTRYLRRTSGASAGRRASGWSDGAIHDRSAPPALRLMRGKRVRVGIAAQHRLQKTLLVDYSWKACPA